MSVLIKGMKMPVQCASCILWTKAVVDRGKTIDICRATHKKMENPYGQRQDWCPLTEVPPHGRLIDFPCEVDDILYEVDDPSFGVIVCKVYSVNYSRQRARLAEDAEMRDCVSVLVKVIDGHGIGSAYSFSIEDFGKSIFLTREEAEAAINAPTIIESEGES